MVEHRYGGPWTEIKLDALQSYLTFYATALKNQPFELWYVDAFAGSGDRVVERLTGGLFEGVASHHADVVLDGSAKRALAVHPPFQRLVFIEDKAERYRALLKLKASNPDRRIECFKADANSLVRAICNADHWRSPTSKGRRVRAVVFLDPYGMQVEWSMLEAIRDTRAVDLLYLFPIGPVLRQAAIDLSRVDQAKENALTRLYGGNTWRQDWYKESPQSDWLQVSPTMLRDATKQQIESGFKARLETLFPYVSEPLPLLTPRGAQLFSLFLAVSNQNPSAIALAKRAVTYIMRAPQRQAFHRKSSP